jgi:hypothetical protein
MKILTIVGVIALLLLLPVSCSLYSTYSATVSAPGRVITKTLETNNIVYNYEYFYDVNASDQSRAGQIKQYKVFADEESDPVEKVRLRTEQGAMQQSCRELVAEYNANSAKANRSIFKGGNLPTQLEPQTCE